MSEVKTEKKVAAKKNEKVVTTKSAANVDEKGHPVQHKVSVVLSNKETIEIMTTWGKEGDVLRADADPFNHPAWQDGAKSFVNPNNDNMNKFIKKFGGFSGV